MKASRIAVSEGVRSEELEGGLEVRFAIVGGSD